MQKDLIDIASQVLAQDNVELACCFVQKNAVEKAIPEIDKVFNSVSIFTCKIFYHNKFNSNLCTKNIE